MSDLPKRIITAILLGAVVIGGTIYSDITYGLVLIIIGFFSAVEYTRLASFNAEISHPTMNTRISAIICVVPLLFYLIGTTIFLEYSLAIAILLSLLVMSIYFMYFLVKNEVGDWRMYQACSMALIYIGMPLLFFYWVSTKNGMYNWRIPMTLLILIWTNDSMAYFTGRLFGSRPLYKLISPKKTIEGFLGGLIFTVIVALILSYYIQNLSPIQWVVYGFIVSIIATAGDLFESMIKRRYGVKDSGDSLPGHGGFLDRFDAFIFLLPISTIIIHVFWTNT